MGLRICFPGDRVVGASFHYEGVAYLLHGYYARCGGHAVPNMGFYIRCTSQKWACVVGMAFRNVWGSISVAQVKRLMWLVWRSEITGLYIRCASRGCLYGWYTVPTNTGLRTRSAGFRILRGWYVVP